MGRMDERWLLHIVGSGIAPAVVNRAGFRHEHPQAEPGGFEGE